MKKLKTLLLLGALITGLNQNIAQNFQGLEFGTDATLDIVTWNLEWFPKNGSTTVNHVKNMMLAMDADIYALQEIDNKNALQQLVNELPAYEAYYINYDDYQGLAYVYNTERLNLIDRYQIYEGYGRQFPRAPLVLEVEYNQQRFVIINNHLKCCGDESMNPYDEWDEETRRYDASKLLDDYIDKYFTQEKVILLGDLNDEITDRMVDNVFQIFINQPQAYLFADMDIAESSSSGWSYPSWPSHLDHILITNELFDDYASDDSRCVVIMPDEYFSGGFSEYDDKVTDHRPVGIRLAVDAAGLTDYASSVGLEIYPNPFTQFATVSFSPSSKNRILQLHHLSGELIQDYQIPAFSDSFELSVKAVCAGHYYLRLSNENAYHHNIIPLLIY
jgi:endonuclease/exonuclease/phosphatase family metal-dependent hydrolase